MTTMTKQQCLHLHFMVTMVTLEVLEVQEIMEGKGEMGKQKEILEEMGK